MVKNPPANAGDLGSIPGSGRSPGEGNIQHSNILGILEYSFPGNLAWEIPWTEEPGRLQSMRSQRVGYGLGTEHTQLPNKVIFRDTGSEDLAREPEGAQCSL